ncbi:sensor histidine kinase [Asanoa sp. NPDC049573]|uniref:sensor histidine kinase n=1 Tax=Asanoa sp. NPDC049573 TaxID=3155396 RepID=UPI00343A9319
MTTLVQAAARLPLVRWTWARRVAVLDVIVAAVTTGVEIGVLVDGWPGVTATAIVLTVLAGALLTVRRRLPLVVLSGTGALAAVEVALHGYPGGAPVIVAMYTVAQLCERWISLAVLLPTAALLQVGSISSPPIAIGAWALGAYVQTRHRYTAALEDRAAHLERERDQAREIAKQQERASIARELHDIVAHSVTVMLLGVRGARDVMRTAPEVADETLRGVERTAEESVAELRRILAVLRGPDQVADVRPPPGLALLEELVDGYRTAGLPVELRIQGPARPLDSGIELSVYRIVEEALTNVLRHARPNTVAVALRFHPSTLEVEIEDDGAPVAPTRAGHGILGMRERVAALGGVIDVGERAGGGFRVGARLPIDEAA